MKANNKNMTMNAQQQRDDFQTVWERRKQNWQEQAKKTLPDNATLLHLSELARQQAQKQEAVVVPITRRRNRWLPYAAAATLVIGVTTFGLTREGKPEHNLPVAEEIRVEGETIHFLCNNGCSANEVLLAANEVIK